MIGEIHIGPNNKTLIRRKTYAVTVWCRKNSQKGTAAIDGNVIKPGRAGQLGSGFDEGGVYLTAFKVADQVALDDPGADGVFAVHAGGDFGPRESR